MLGVLQELIDEMVVKVRNDKDTTLIVVLMLEVFGDSWGSAVLIFDKRKENV